MRNLEEVTKELIDKGNRLSIATLEFNTILDEFHYVRFMENKNKIPKSD